MGKQLNSYIPNLHRSTDLREKLERAEGGLCDTQKGRLYSNVQIFNDCMLESTEMYQQG